MWGKAVDAGMVHGLVLMLLATGMVVLKVKSQKLVGTNDIKLSHVDVILGKSTIVNDEDDEVIETLAILDESLWEHFHFR